jgi:hypothetical protein
MGPCPICGDPVALYSTRVIGLKNRLSGSGDSGEEIQELARVIMEYINNHSGPVDEDGIERLIQETDASVNSGRETKDPEHALSVLPSIRNPEDPPITREEVDDFLKIDVHLLGKKEYFDKYFS